MADIINGITIIAALKEAYPLLVAKIQKDALGEDMESKIQITRDAKGNIAEWSEEIRDNDGKLITKRVDKYSFFPSGEINIITQQILDDKGQKAERQIEHYIEEKQPTIK